MTNQAEAATSFSNPWDIPHAHHASVCGCMFVRFWHILVLDDRPVERPSFLVGFDTGALPSAEIPEFRSISRPGNSFLLEMLKGALQGLALGFALNRIEVETAEVEEHIAFEALPIAITA